MDTLTLAQIIEAMQGAGTAADLAARADLSQSALCRAKQGTRQQAPAEGVIAKLLCVAEPEHQAAILQVLGIEDVEQFATALLAAAGVPPVVFCAPIGNPHESEYSVAPAPAPVAGGETVTNGDQNGSDLTAPP